MISQCHKKNDHEPSSSDHSPLSVSCTTVSSQSHFRSLQGARCHGTTDKQQRMHETTSSDTEEDESEDNYAENSGAFRRDGDIVTREPAAFHSSNVDIIQNKSLQSEDESQTCSFEQYLHKDRNITSADWQNNVESSPFSGRAGLKSTRDSGMDTKISSEPSLVNSTQHHLTVTKAVIHQPRHGSDSPSLLSPSVCDAAGESQFDVLLLLEEIASCAESEVDSSSIQPSSTQDSVQHQQREDEEEYLSICSEKSAEELSKADTELSHRSSSTLTVTADVHAPALPLLSPPLYSDNSFSDEQDIEAGSRSLQMDDESANMNEEVSSLVM